MSQFPYRKLLEKRYRLIDRSEGYKEKPKIKIKKNCGFCGKEWSVEVKSDSDSIYCISCCKEYKLHFSCSADKGYATNSDVFPYAVKDLYCFRCHKLIHKNFIYNFMIDDSARCTCDECSKKAKEIADKKWKFCAHCVDMDKCHISIKGYRVEVGSFEII